MLYETASRATAVLELNVPYLDNRRARIRVTASVSIVARPFAREQDAEQCGDALVRERGAGAVSIAATSPRQPCSFASSSG